jgi:hypothetical protein
MSDEVRADARLIVLRALAGGENVGPPIRCRIMPSPTIVGREDARMLLARMSKPISCVSETEDDTLVPECRQLEERYHAVGIVEAWMRFTRHTQEGLIQRIEPPPI